MSGNHHPADRRALLWCGAIGAPLFVVVFVIEDSVPSIRPAGYHPLRHAVSLLAIGPLGWMQVASFVVSGLLLFAFAVGLRQALRGYLDGISAPVLVGLIGIGLVGAGVFTTDPFGGYPPGTPTISGRPDWTIHGALHQVFSLLVFLGLPAACCVIGYRFARAGRKGWACYSIGTAVVVLTLFVLFSRGFAQHSTFVSIGGLLQRLTLITGLTWIAALALHLIRRQRQETRTAVDSLGR
jgi:hypothetical membrane protein